MKISKLFHWLYAVLMFLPLMVFLPTGFYYAFNDNAQSQEYTKQEPIYYESNEVNSASDIQQGKIYYFTDNVDMTSLPNLLFVGKLNYDLVINQNDVPNNIPANSNAYLYCQPDYFRIYFRQNVAESSQIYCQFNVAQNFVFEEIYNSSFLDFIYPYCEESDYLFVKEYQEVTYTMSIADSMSNAWVHTWEMPLFGWSANTFINEPFSYITSLFNIPNDSTFSSAFGYWVSISICWLVFDVIMYVPLLAHRWIDKARLE